MKNNIANSQAFFAFKKNVALRKVSTTIQYPKDSEEYREMSHQWSFYSDGELTQESSGRSPRRSHPEQNRESTVEREGGGTKDAKQVPMICLGGISGRADQFFDLMLRICPRGYWIISVDLPPISSYLEFILAFEAFLQYLKIDRCHLLGAQLGGFLAQMFADAHPDMVDSLVLCNTFISNLTFSENNVLVDFYNYLPAFVLKKHVLSSFPQDAYTKPVNDSIEFMVDHLESLSRKELASRLVLNSIQKRLPPTSQIDDQRVTIIDTLDETIYPQHMRDAVYKRFPNARLAFMKMGNVFPYISNSEEFALHVHVHLRNATLTSSVLSSDDSFDDRGEAGSVLGHSEDGDRTSIVNNEDEEEDEDFARTSDSDFFTYDQTDFDSQQ